MTFCADPHPLFPDVLCGQPEGHLLRGLPHLPASGVADQDVKPWGLVPFVPVLTATQRKVLRTITAYVQQMGFPPSVREIAEAVGLASNASVHYQLRQLERKGFLSRVEGKARAMSVTAPEEVGS